jgi:hypothetical protein
MVHTANAIINYNNLSRVRFVAPSQITLVSGESPSFFNFRSKLPLIVTVGRPITCDLIVIDGVWFIRLIQLI